jgi:hypothetical protein
VGVDLLADPDDLVVLRSNPFDLSILIFGQSAHGYGFAVNELSGAGTTAFAPKGRSGGDSGLGFATPFPACRFSQDSADGPTNPQTYPVHTGVEDLQLYAAPGAANVGIAAPLGRFLVRNRIATQPAIGVCAIGSTSVFTHWAPNAFPASGEKLYAHLRDFGLNWMTTFGRPIDLLWWGIGDSDAGTPARVTAMQTDTATLLAALRSDWGLPNLPVFMGMVHPDLQSPADAAGYRAKQIAFQPTDVDCTLVDASVFCKLEQNPHFLMGALNTYGNFIATRIRDKFKPGLNLDLQSGPTPWVQGGEACYTSGASPLTARPIAYVEPKATPTGDIEILMAHGATVAHTVSLTTAASFTSLIAQTDAVNGAAHRSMTLWSRTIDSTMLAARTAQPDGVKRGPCATPEVDFGVATLNLATIWCVRGSSGIAQHTIGTTINASLSIPGFTTTANNALVMFLFNGSGATGGVSSIVNANIQGITKVRDTHQVNAGAGLINSEMWIGTVPVSGTVVGSTAVTFGAAILGVGAIIVFNP